MTIARKLIHPVHDQVCESLAAADPFYRGPHRSTQPIIEETVRPVDPHKTARDLGREETGEWHARMDDYRSE